MFEDITNRLILFLNSEIKGLDIPFILAYQDENRISKPFGTLFLAATKSELKKRVNITVDGKNTEKQTFNLQTIFQIDMYNDKDNLTQKALLIKSYLKSYKFWEWGKMCLNIIDISDFKNLPKIVKNRYEHRISFDITLEINKDVFVETKEPFNEVSTNFGDKQTIRNTDGNKLPW